jgi:hypothetical protein
MNKKDILSEISRTAKENNGIPLGRMRFEKETGIKYTDWYGKYWSKWSDAIREAGLKPNKMQSAYDEKWLIEQVIFLIREIKRFPTVGDIRMKAFNAERFPAHNTIRKLGTKSEMVQKILAYCKDNPEYQDIMKICSETQNIFKKKDEYIRDEADIQFGYVYLMKSGRYYKIGRSSYVEKRSYELGIKLPEELKVIHKIKTDDPAGIESYWHKRYEEKRKKGEWFNLSSSDIKAFKRRKFM